MINKSDVALLQEKQNKFNLFFYFLKNSEGNQEQEVNQGGIQMKKIQIDKIVVKENIRKDYGDLTELAASISINGMRNPVELNSKNELIDGFRRIKAAKSAGLEEVPYFVNEEEMGKTASQLISGIFQKSLNPIEEGIAFRNYMDHKKIDIERLALKISKKVSYVEKRLQLVDLPKDVQKALIEKKILMGHALLLARFTKQDSSKFLREIINNHQSVEDARENVGYSDFSCSLSGAKFDKKDCKDCQYNGSKQSELFETGKILNGDCLNQGCFKTKLKQFIKQKKEEFKGFIYEADSDYSSPKGFVDGSQEWECKDKGITDKYKDECKKDPENYMVKIQSDGEVTEYFKTPSKKKVDGKVQASTQEEGLNERREETLLAKVNEFKTQFLIDKSIELMQPGTKQVKALALLRMVQNAGWEEFDDKEMPGLVKDGRGSLSRVKNIFNAKESELDEAIKVFSKKALRGVDLKELITISRNFKVDIKKQFEITEDYLKLYTKSQLVDLIEEVKIYVDADDPAVESIASGNIKKDELIHHILTQKLKGKVPKILM